MTILITGGAGFIGSHTADALLATGHAVRILDSLEPPVHQSGWPAYVPRNAEKVQGSVTDRKVLAEALNGVDAVYHFAAYQDYLQDFSRFFSVNAVGTALLYELIVENHLPVRKIIVASSQAAAGEGLYQCPQHGRFCPDMRMAAQLEAAAWDLVCPTCQGGLRLLPTPESACNAQNSYGLSKLTQERIAIQLGQRYGIPSVALRYSIVLGPRQAFSNPYSGACRAFCLSFHCGQRPTIYEDGLQLRDFVHVKDVVAANLLVLADDRSDYEVFNVGGGRAHTVLEMAHTVAALYTADVELEPSGIYRFGDTRHAVSSIEKLRALGWTPRKTMYDGASSYREWLRECKPPRSAVDSARGALKNSGILKVPFSSRHRIPHK